MNRLINKTLQEKPDFKTNTLTSRLEITTKTLVSGLETENETDSKVESIS